MRFTEHELTLGLHGAAKSVLAARRGAVPKGSTIDEVWDSMDRMARFRVLDGLGSQVLPVLVALPDVEIAPGTRASYDEETITEVVTAQLGDSALGKIKRALVVKGRVALVQIALAAMPPRRDADGLLHADPEATGSSDLPDDFHVPDDLSGL